MRSTELKTELKEKANDDRSINFNKAELRNTMKTFTAYVEYDSETKLYVGIISGISGAHTQAESLDELQINLKEVLELCLEEYDKQRT